MANDSLYDRYQYLRHLYTCLFEVHQNGGTCFDPLFYYFPEDDTLFTNPEESFIVGGALKVSPVLASFNGTTGARTYSSYFPKGKWVSLIDYSIIDNSAEGALVNLTAGNTVQVHLKEGSIIPF
jgi:alpha-glucosidase